MSSNFVIRLNALKAETGSKLTDRDTAVRLRRKLPTSETNLTAAEKTRGAQSPDVIALQHKLEKPLRTRWLSGDHDTSRGSISKAMPTILPILSWFRN